MRTGKSSRIILYKRKYLLSTLIQIQEIEGEVQPFVGEVCDITKTTVFITRSD